MKNKLIKLGQKSGFDIEIFEDKNDCVNISTLNDEVKLFQTINVSTYNIKAIKNNKCISLITENLRNSKEIIEALEEIYFLQDNANKNEFCKGSKIVNVEDEQIDYKNVINDLISLNDLKKTYSLISSIEIEYNHVLNGSYINNNVNKCDMQNETYFNAYSGAITIKENDNVKTLYVCFYTKEYNFDEFKKYLVDKLKYLLIKLNSTSVKTDRYNVLMCNHVVESILKAFTNAFQSKSVFMKESVFQDKLNKQMFSDKITIVEDSKNGIANVLFDNEGTLKKYQEIVKDGVFVKTINDIEYAYKMNEDKTGNAGGVNNLYIKPKDKDFNELLDELNTGIIIDEVFGVHAGIDKKTGNISLQAEGIFVKDKKMIKGLNMIILSTNIFELFNNVLEVGNDLSKTNLSVSTPSLLLHDITIAGKEENNE